MNQTVTRHSDNFTALKIVVMTKANFITNFTYEVYNKHPDGRTLVYSYRLSYWPTARADHPPGLAAQTKQSGHRRLAGRDRRRRPPISRNRRARQLPGDLSEPGWSGGVAVPHRLMSPITIDDKSSKPPRSSSASCGPTSLGYPFSSLVKSTRG